MVWIKKLLFGEGKDQRVIKVEVSGACAKMVDQRSSADNYLPGVSEKYTSGDRWYYPPVSSVSYVASYPRRPSIPSVDPLSIV